MALPSMSRSDAVGDVTHRDRVALLLQSAHPGQDLAAEELDAGLSFVNENVRSDPRMPFGGIKHSGYGRECSSFGIREFTNIKSVHVRPLEHGTGNAVE